MAGTVGSGIGHDHGTRWALALLLVVIAAALLLVAQNAFVMKAQLAEDFNQQQLVLARQAAAAIKHRVADVESEAASLAEMIGRGNPPRETLDVSLDSMLKRCRDLGVTSVRLVDGSGRVVVTKGTPLMDSVPTPFDWSQLPPGSTGTTVVGPRTVLHEDDGPWHVADQLTAVVGSEAVARAVTVDVDLTGLIGEVASTIRSGRSGYLWVLDRAGIFLYHPDSQFVGRNAFRARQHRAPEIDFRPINQIMSERMLHGEEGTGRYLSGWHRGMTGRIHKLIAFAPLHNPGASVGEVWSVAVVAPQEEVAAPTRRVFRRHIEAAVVLVGALLLVGWVLVGATRRSARRLKRQVERTEAELHEIEQIHRRVVDQASDMIYILDTDGQIVLANPPTLRLFRWLSAGVWDAPVEPPKELYLGRSLADVLPQEDASFVERKMDLALFCGRGISFEHSIQMAEDKRRLSTRLMPIRADRGGVRWVLGITRDVTEKVALEQRLYNAEKLASIGTLAAGVAHEINNPLAVILGFTELLRERLPDDTQEHEDLTIIEDQANVAKEVVENLLGFARLTEGLEDSADVGAAIRKVVAVVANTLLTRKIELVQDIEQDLPRVRGDAREFQQVIFNLVTNAMAALSEGGGLLTLAARRDGDAVEFEVRDNGPGIPERIRAQIFDPFFTTKPVGQGTGLGLSLCYGIVSRYGGTIAVSSTAAEDQPDGPTGTCFTVRLPVAKGETTA